MATVASIVVAKVLNTLFEEIVFRALMLLTIAHRKGNIRPLRWSRRTATSVTASSRT